MEGFSIQKHEIIFEGFLVRQANYLQEWRRQWCVLTPEYFCSFKSRSDYTNPTTVIRLDQCLSISSDPASDGPGASFCVTTREQVMWLLAETPHLRNNWMARLGRQLLPCDEFA
ncbi:PH1 [Symbiodinium pilosum]|uniref:PH1 protein n=1 Tax=Symbiodinium pilosum TaxID=2952 RepID=A0A812PV50_SYMPI|nr:PH1 [Symbiodinium pilosum]